MAYYIIEISLTDADVPALEPAPGPVVNQRHETYKAQVRAQIDNEGTAVVFTRLEDCSLVRAMTKAQLELEKFQKEYGAHNPVLTVHRED